MSEITKYLTKSTMSGSDINEAVNLVDQESANSIYRRCAAEFDFKIVTLEGKIYSISEELFSVFGYSNRDALSKVLRKNLIETLDIRNVHFGRSLILQGFGLSPSTTRLNLIDYRGFLTVALEGQGTACDRVREYLLKMETKARIDTVIYETTGMDASDFQAVGKYAEDPIMQSMMEGQKRMKEIMQLRAQQLETQELAIETQKQVKKIETQIEAELSITPQQEHQLNLRKDELISLQVKKNRAYQHFWRNVKDRFKFGVWTGLERSKFPLVMEYLDGLILQEQGKLNQLTLFQPVVTYPPEVTITVH